MTRLTTAEGKADIDEMVESLLADRQYLDHPLRKALLMLWVQNREQIERLERIAHISDGYQSMAREKTLSLAARYDRQLRKLEKAARISDRYQQMLQDLNNALERASTHDQLTGLANRRLLTERLKEESRRCERQGTTYTLALLDLDHFKAINDTYGHESGDIALVAIARAMEQGLRDYDLCGRWGGEEFLVVLPQLDPDAAGSAVERIRANVGATRLQLGTNTQALVTVSIGVTQYRIGETYGETINRADTALRDAKNDGRNCVRRR